MTKAVKNKKSAVVDVLALVLADSFVVYYKTHASHWNVESPHFKSLHDLFMQQYTELWTALDDIAERMRALDAYAPLSMKTLLGLADIKEYGQNRDAKQMLKELADDNALLAETLAAGIEIAEAHGDQPTVDLLTVRQGVHEKNAWMLRASAA